MSFELEATLKLARFLCMHESAKDLMNLGDRIFLPITVEELPSEKHGCHCKDEEINFIHGLELYKDPAIIVVNKPSGLPVQGGICIKRSFR